MKQELPISTWLDVLTATMPAKGTLLVGAGAGTGPFVQWLQTRAIGPVWLLEGNERQYQQLRGRIPTGRDWTLRPGVVATNGGPTEFYQMSNPAESGLIPAERLRKLWGNLATLATTQVDQTVTLDMLFTDTGGVVNWLFLDCLPAAELLRGGQQLLSQLDVAVVRVVSGEFLDEPSAQRDSVDNLLCAAGLRCIHSRTERHPALAHAVYVKNVAQQTEMLAQLSLEAVQSQLAYQEELSRQRSEYETRLEEIRVSAERELSSARDEGQAHKSRADELSHTLAAALDELNKLKQAQAQETANLRAQLAECTTAARKEKEDWRKEKHSLEQTLQQTAEASSNKIKALEAKVNDVTEALARAEEANQQRVQNLAIAEEQRRESALQAERELWHKEQEVRAKRYEDVSKLAAERRAQILALERRIRDLQSSAGEPKSSANRPELPTVQDQVRVEQLATIDLGEAWAGNTVNTVIFRHHGILTCGEFQFAAFYVDESRLRVVRRLLATNEIAHNDIPGEYNLRDAHNSISLGVDRLGCLHICYDHHGTRLRYRRSTAPHDIFNWTDELPMTGVNEGRVTYPTFILPRAGHPLTLLYRDGQHNKGTARLKTFDEDKQAWADHPLPILSGAEQRPWTSNAYWNHPAVGADGSLHLSFVWRTDTLGEHHLVNNINMGYAWSPDNGMHWFTASGQPYRLPITPTTAETIWPSSLGNNLINQTGMALDSRDRPHITFYANDAKGIPQYQHVWFNGQQWLHEAFSNRQSPFVLKGGGTLQIPISRPDVLIDASDRVYAIFRADFTEQRLAIALLPCATARSRTCDTSMSTPLWPYSVGYTEPVIDRARWRRDNILSLLVQHTQQPDGDLSHVDTRTTVSIIDLRVNPAQKISAATFGAIG